MSSRKRCRDVGAAQYCIPRGGSGTPGPNAICGRPQLSKGDGDGEEKVTGNDPFGRTDEERLTFEKGRL
jgi:hypothetical protein